MEIPRCIAIATINGRTIAAAYSGFEDPTRLPPGVEKWPSGEPALKEMAGAQRQAETSREGERGKKAAS